MRDISSSDYKYDSNFGEYYIEYLTELTIHYLKSAKDYNNEKKEK